MWKIWFRKVKSKVSSTGKFHFGLPKKQKIGLSYTDFVICLYIKLLQKYNPHWNLHWNLHWTRTGTYTDKYCFGFPPTDFGFTRNQVMMTRMKRTKRMVLWLSLGFQLQRYNKKLSFPNFGEYLSHTLRQSVIYVNRWRYYGAHKHEAVSSYWRDSKNCSCQSCSSWKNLRESSVLCY